MFVADLHNDLVQRMMIGEDVTKNTSSGHTDIERLKLSAIDLEVMIVWASEKEANTSYFEFASKMYEKLKALENVDGVSIPITLEDIKIAKQNNQLSLPIAMEGGEALENKIENLEYFINKGLFYFGPTWNHSLDWVSSGYGETHKKSTLKTVGLNKFGVEVINICQENNVLVDMSHIGEKSFWDTIAITKKPIIASHSSVYNLCPHFRNLKDDQKNLNSFIQGFAISILNPKILIWFTAIFSQFIEASSTSMTKLTMVFMASSIDGIWYIIVTIVVTGFGLKQFLENNTKTIQNISGIVLIFISLIIFYKMLRPYLF